MARKDFLASSRKLRRKRLILKAIVVSVIFVAVFTGIVAFFRIPYFQVKKIEISGNSLIDGDDLTDAVKVKMDGKYLWLFPKTNIFIMSKDKILASHVFNFAKIITITLLIYPHQYSHLS